MSRPRPGPADLRLLAIGRLRDDTPEAALFQRYAARLRPPLIVTELPEVSGTAADSRRRENAALRAALAVPGPRHFTVALDHGGDAVDSLGFAGKLQRWHALQPRLCFVIGGTEGLEQATIGLMDATLSLGPMTWPHLLVRALLAEQLFRAQSIATGHPYHRAGRPA